MSISIFVGDVDDSVALKAKQHDPNAYLVDHSNFEKFLKTDFQEPVTVYTSHGDLPKNTKDRCVFYEVLNKADIIYYSPPKNWSDMHDEFMITNQKSLTLYFLLLINQEKNNVVGLDISEYHKNKYISLRRYRTSDSKVVWSAGCSITNGVGVSSTEKYPAVVSTMLNLPLIDLSMPGSSIEYAADQILRSDIKENDIVIWGLTEETRFAEWDSKLQRVSAGERTRTTLTETRVYKSVISVHQVVNFCNKIKAKLIMIPLLCSENFRLLISGLNEVYHLPYQTKSVDYGSDSMHPGPEQHKLYADFVLKIISKGQYV